MKSNYQLQVAVIGNCYYDEIYLIEKIPVADDKILAEDVKITLGGSASNTAVGLTKLGISTSLFTAVGDDITGKHLIEELKSRKIITDNIVESAGTTGRTIILLDKNKSSTKIGYQGVCNELYKILEFKFIGNNFHHIHLASTRIETIENAIENKVDTPLSIDIGAKTLMATDSELLAIFQKVDIVFMNQGTFKRMYNNNISNQSISSLLEEKFPFDLIVTAGELGVYAIISNNVYYQRSISTIVADTTGAGDSFASAFIWSRYHKNNPRDMLKFAVSAASIKIKSFGGSNGNPSVDEVEALLIKS